MRELQSGSVKALYITSGHALRLPLSALRRRTAMWDVAGRLCVRALAVHGEILCCAVSCGVNPTAEPHFCNIMGLDWECIVRLLPSLPCMFPDLRRQ